MLLPANGAVAYRVTRKRCKKECSRHVEIALSGSIEENVSKTLENKALDLLNSRLLKLKRRAARRKQSAESVASGAPINWLVKKLCQDLHYYLRLKRFYCNEANPTLTGASVGSPKWCLAVSKALESFLTSRPGLFLVTGPNDSTVIPLRKSETALTPAKVKHSNRLKASDAEGLFSVTCGRSAKEMVLLVKKYYMKKQVDDVNPNHFVDMTAGVGGISVKALTCFDRVDCYETDEKRYQLLLDNVKAHLGSSRTEKVTCFCEDSIEGMRQRAAGPACAIFDPPWGGLGYDKSKDIFFNGKPLHTILEELAGFDIGTDGLLTKPPCPIVSVVGIKLPLGYDIKTHIMEPKSDLKAAAWSKFIKLVFVKKIWKQLFAIFEFGP